MKELEFDHEKQMGEIEVQMLEKENTHELALADKQLIQTETEGEIEKEVTSIGAFQESLKAQREKSGVKIVDSIRFLMRPAITLYLLVITTMLTCKVDELVGGMESLTISELFALYKHIVMTIVFLTVTAVTWWFGSRGDKAPK